MPALQIQLLGTFLLRYDGEPLAGLHQARLQSLLAYLLLHRAVPQARQQLAFLFWPDSSEPQAYSNLRKALSTLRTTLPDAEQFLSIDAKVVQWRLDAPFTLDVADFEQHLTESERARQKGDMMNAQAHLEMATELYAGDLVPECYDDWIVPERERLRERFLEALMQLSKWFEQARAYQAAIRQANRLLRSDPLHEETYRRLMRLHVLNGDRAAALRTYHTCAASLQRELGVKPSPPTQKAYAQLLHLETAPLAPAGQGRRRREMLVGRQAEWRRLMVAWLRTTQGEAQFILVGGEPGIGKTRLVEEVAHWTRQQGFATAYTRAYAAEGALSYDPIAAWLVEVARLAPEVRTQHPHLSTPHPLTESWQRRHFFEALARAVLALPEPLLLVLDDLQWCDRETLEWLHYLLRFDPHARLLVLGTARLGEIDAGHPLRSLLRELRPTGQVTEIELAPLASSEVAQLANQVSEQALTAEQMAMIQRVSEGNPLLLHELVQAETVSRQQLAEFGRQVLASSQETPLPAKLQAVIEARLVQLSPEARQLAALAATIGRSFTFALLRQASGESEDRLVAALDELWQRRLVREQGSDSYDFSHDTIRVVTYASISPMRLRRLHH
jgi:DNA-binding SARP family transcriptional activator